MAGRTPMGRFVQYKWNAMSQRAGKDRHTQTAKKCKSYENVYIRFTRPEFKAWCLERENLILNLKRPSIDRIDSKLDYTLDNIQILELEENIRKEKIKAKDGFCVCFYCKQNKSLDLFAKDKRRYNGRGTYCRECDNKRRKRS